MKNLKLKEFIYSDLLALRVLVNIPSVNSDSLLFRNLIYTSACVHIIQQRYLLYIEYFIFNLIENKILEKILILYLLSMNHHR